MTEDRKRLQREWKILLAKQASGRLLPDERQRLNWLEFQLNQASASNPALGQALAPDPLATEDDAEIPRDDEGLAALRAPANADQDLLQALEDDVGEDIDDDPEEIATADYNPVSLQKESPPPAEVVVEVEAPVPVPEEPEPPSPISWSAPSKPAHQPPPLPKKKTPLHVKESVATPSLPVLRAAPVPQRGGSGFGIDDEDTETDSAQSTALEDLLGQDDFPDPGSPFSSPQGSEDPVLRSATIHYLDGVTRRGMIANFDPQADCIRLIPQGGSEEIVEEVDTEQLKTIFLMTQQEGGATTRDGCDARVSLIDGRTLEGLIPDYDPEQRAFMLYPKVERGNIDCIVVYRRAVMKINIQDP